MAMRSLTAVLTMVAALAVSACATAPGGETASSAPVGMTFDHFCGAGADSCHAKARARCASGQADIVERPSVKMRRDLRVTCMGG